MSRNLMKYNTDTCHDPVRQYRHRSIIDSFHGWYINHTHALTSFSYLLKFKKTHFPLQLAFQSVNNQKLKTEVNSRSYSSSGTDLTR